MDLPKNITQIGEADASCKIYVEDYVVSYLKQLNPLARDKTMAAALYGKRKTEDNKSFLFVYGAGKLDFIQKETKHLSQAQWQEIERIRRQYFQDYEFLGYRILDGEMVDGFHVCEQEVCRYVSGYAQFYEKNEAMLSYMLESRQAEATPEAVNYEKYDAARGRQEKRRAKYAKHGEERTEEEASVKARRGGLQVAVAALFVLLCALGLAMNSSALEEKGLSWDRLKEEFLEKKLPDATEVASLGMVTDGAVGQAFEGEKEEVLVASGKVSDEEQEELDASGITDLKQATNASETDGKTTGEGEAKGQTKVTGESEAKGQTKVTGESETKDQTQPAGENVTKDQAQATGDLETKDQTQAAEENEKKEQAQGTKENAQDGQATGTSGENAEKEEKKQVTYVVRAGDTLTGISIRNYGSEKYIGQICKLNSIKNPDEIKIGQKILLP